MSEATVGGNKVAIGLKEWILPVTN